jgi:replication fork protection complex subunit Csm3/Swi3
MIEKLGHKKRIQLMRMEWINEGKPKPTHEDSIFDDPVLPPRENIERVQSPSKIAPIPCGSREGSNRLRTPEVNEEINDIYDATPMAPRTQTSGEVALAVDHESLFRLDKTKTNVTDEPQDDLDALLAEQEMEAINIRASSVLNSQGRSMGAAEHEADELEALAEMEEIW